MKLISLVAGLVFGSSLSAFAEVKNSEASFNFESTDHNKFQLNLSLEREFPNSSGGTSLFANKAEIFVYDRVHPNDKFRAVVTSNCILAGTSDLYQFSQQVDLQPYALKNGVLAFQGMLEKSHSFLNTTYRGYGVTDCVNTISLVKNDSWQVDPINGTTSFVFEVK
jgi:hypothetical protein